MPGKRTRRAVRRAVASNKNCWCCRKIRRKETGINWTSNWPEAAAPGIIGLRSPRRDLRNSRAWSPWTPDASQPNDGVRQQAHVSNTSNGRGKLPCNVGKKRYRDWACPADSLRNRYGDSQKMHVISVNRRCNCGSGRWIWTAAEKRPRIWRIGSTNCFSTRV